MDNSIIATEREVIENVNKELKILTKHIKQKIKDLPIYNKRTQDQHQLALDKLIELTTQLQNITYKLNQDENN